MARRKPLKPLEESKKHWTKAELAERKKVAARARINRFRAKLSKADKKERKQREEASLFHWDRLLPHVDKRDDGCWVWTGPFQVQNTRVRPIVRAGLYGVLTADFVSLCLAKGRPPPRCFVTRLCETLGCIAPAHLAWSNAAVETAKRRRESHEQEKLLRRVE